MSSAATGPADQRKVGDVSVPGPAESVESSTEEPTAAIARYVADLRYADVPALAVRNAKIAILDAIGVAIAGSRTETGRIVTAYVRSAGCADGPSRLFGMSARTSAEYAALANGVMTHAMDFDDRHHASTHVLPAALAVGEQSGATGMDLLTAYVAGREVRMQLNEEFDSARFRGGGPGSRGWHATGTLGTFGAAAAAAKLLGLDAGRIATTFGVAASLCSGLIANFGTMTKPLHAGNAARNGVLSALLTAEGFSGEPAIFSAPKGIVEAMCLSGECDVRRVVEKLRASFHLADHGVEIKPYPSCSQNHVYIATVLAIREKFGITADQVASAECVAIGGLNRLYPVTELEAKFSAAYAIAIALLEGTFAEAHCSVDVINRKDVQDLLRRITYVGEQWGSKPELRITTTDGEVIEEPVLPWRNYTDHADVQAKFRANAVPVLGDVKATMVEADVADLENVPVARLMADASLS
jgi:2-methylcitrate dehydratase PrpD